jgi:hypothetical protein
MREGETRVGYRVHGSNDRQPRQSLPLPESKEYDAQQQH